MTREQRRKANRRAYTVFIIALVGTLAFCIYSMIDAYQISPELVYYPLPFTVVILILLVLILKFELK